MRNISSKQNEIAPSNFIALTQTEKTLLEAALPFIEGFLQEMGEFYPFAMIIDRNGVVSSLQPDIDEEYPISDYLIQFYETVIQKTFSSKSTKYQDAIVCINVIIHDKEDKNAIECRFLHKGQSLHRYYIDYEIQNGMYVWAVVG